jgi:glutathione S-transferase
MEYVEDQVPSPALMPSDPECRARLRLLYDLADHSLEPQVRSFCDADRTKKRQKKADAIVETVRTIVPHLSHDGPYAVGKRFTAADLSVPPVLLTAIEQGFDPTRLPIRIRLWLQTVLDRPSVRRLYPDVRLTARAA